MIGEAVSGHSWLVYFVAWAMDSSSWGVRLQAMLLQMLSRFSFQTRLHHYTLVAHLQFKALQCWSRFQLQPNIHYHINEHELVSHQVEHVWWQALPLVSTFWGVLIFKEYYRSSRQTYILLAAMLIMFSLAVCLLASSSGTRKTSWCGVEHTSCSYSKSEHVQQLLHAWEIVKEAIMVIGGHTETTLLASFCMTSVGSWNCCLQRMY